MPLEEIQKSICKCFQVHSEFKKIINSTPNITEILKLLEGYDNTILNTQSLDALMEAFKMNELHYLVKKKKAFNLKVSRSSEMLPYTLLMMNEKIDMSQVRSVKCIANDSKAVVEGILIDISVLVKESFRVKYGIEAIVDVPGYTIDVFSTGVGTIVTPHSILNAVAGCPSSDPVPKQQQEETPTKEPKDGIDDMPPPPPPPPPLRVWYFSEHSYSHWDYNHITANKLLRIDMHKQQENIFHQNTSDSNSNNTLTNEGTGITNSTLGTTGAAATGTIASPETTASTVDFNGSVEYLSNNNTAMITVTPQTEIIESGSFDLFHLHIIVKLAGILLITILALFTIISGYFCILSLLRFGTLLLWKTDHQQSFFHKILLKILFQQLPLLISSIAQCILLWIKTLISRVPISMKIAKMLLVLVFITFLLLIWQYMHFLFIGVYIIFILMILWPEILQSRMISKFIATLVLLLVCIIMLYGLWMLFKSPLKWLLISFTFLLMLFKLILFIFCIILAVFLFAIFHKRIFRAIKWIWQCCLIPFVATQLVGLIVLFFVFPLSSGSYFWYIVKTVLSFALGCNTVTIVLKAMGNLIFFVGLVICQLFNLSSIKTIPFNDFGKELPKLKP